MMKKTLATLIAILIGTVAFNQTSIPKAQTLFIYNFSRLIEWPVDYRTGPFVIGVIGGSDVAGELETYTKGKKVGVQEISIIRYSTPQEIKTCHILFVPYTKTKQIPEILGLLNGKCTLIITEKFGALENGSGINFLIQGDKLKFELKADNATKFGMKFSSKLQEMATL
jgi:hypothetical protein